MKGLIIMEQKRSLKYLIMAACVALLVASIGGIVVGAQDNVPYTEGYEIEGATLDLNDKVSIGFLVEAAKVNYDAENNTATGTVHTYATNPTGNANDGDDVLAFSGKTVKRTVDGVEKTYLLYLTDGINMVDYGVDVYARVINGEAVGQAKRVNVLELAYLMKENPNASQGSQKLVSSLINYYETAYKVVAFDGKESGVASPYKLIKVEDGYIAEEGLENTTMRVAKEGTELNLVNNYDAYSEYPFAGWQSGSSFSSSGVIAVSESDTYVPLYMSDNNYNYNPDVDGVIYTYATSYTYSTPGTKGGTASYGTKTTSASDKISWNELSYKMVMNKVDSGYELSETFSTGALEVSYGTAQADRKIYRDETTNEPVSLTSYSKTPNDGKEFAGSTPYQSYYFSHDAVSGSIKLSLDLMIPSVDTDNDGIENELSDFLTDDTNTLFLLIPLSVTDTKASNNLMYVRVSGNIYNDLENDMTRINGFTLGTSAGDTSGNQHDQNLVEHEECYNLDVWYTLTFDIKLNDDAQPESVSLYMEDDLVYTRTADALGETGLSIGAVDGISVAGKDVVAGVQDFGRYQGAVAVKAPTVQYGHVYTADDIDALVANADYDVMVDDYSTSTLVKVTSLDGTKQTGSKKAGSEYSYDAKSDSIILTQGIGTGVGESMLDVFVTNPLKALKANGEDYTGKSTVMEFDMTLPMTDTDGDGIFGEWEDYATFNLNSSMKAYMYWRTASTFADTHYVTRHFSSMRINTVHDFKANGSLPYWNLTYRHFNGFLDSDGNTIEDSSSLDAVKYAGTSNGADGSDKSTTLTGNTSFDTTKKIKIIMTPDDKGIISRLDFYCNGSFVTTVYNNGKYKSTDSMTFYINNPAYLADTTKTNIQWGRLANLYNDSYVGFNYFFESAARYGNVVFSNVQSYVVNSPN